MYDCNGNAMPNSALLWTSLVCLEEFEANLGCEEAKHRCLIRPLCFHDIAHILRETPQRWIKKGPWARERGQKSLKKSWSVQLSALLANMYCLEKRWCRGLDCLQMDYGMEWREACKICFPFSFFFILFFMSILFFFCKPYYFSWLKTCTAYTKRNKC